MLWPRRAWRYRVFRAAIVAALLALTQVAEYGPLHAGDWPQILGPGRNGIARDESLLDSWPDRGPAVQWQVDVGDGFAGPAVHDGTLVLFHRKLDREIVEAFDAGSGQSKWSVDYPAEYVPTYTSDGGPRAVPLIHNGQIFIYGALGGLRAIDLATGNKRWERDTFEEFNSKKRVRGEPAEGYFGIGSTPILVDGKLLVNVGGDTNQAGIVAFDPANGKTLWTATSERASYSSPIAAVFGDTKHVIFAARFNIVSVDPANGHERFRFPFGRPGPNVTAANPLVLGNKVFVSASYGFGATLAEIGPAGAKIVWHNDDVMSSQYTTCVEDNGFLYGIHGRQDVGLATLRCFDPLTQKIHWSQEDFGYATLIKADGKLLILKTDGELVLAEVNPKEFHELARASIFKTETRALPALSDGLLFARDTRSFKCLSVGKTRAH